MRKLFHTLVMAALAGVITSSAPILAARQQEEGQQSQFLPESAPGAPGVQILQPVNFDISPPLRDMKPAPRPSGPPREAVLPGPVPVPPSTGEPDPVVQNWNGPVKMPSPNLNFEGVGQGFVGPQGTFTVQYAPPDTNGDVGPNNYVQIVNTDYAVFDRSGTVLYGPVPSNTVWSGFGGGCQTNNDGDAVVKYDKRADRWVISQFSVSTTPYLQCVAVSTTGDPTGSYARYSFQFSDFPDYPKIGIWPDAYYFTFNMFNGNSFVGAEPCAFDRSKMIAGQPATAQCFSPLGSSQGGVLPSDLDGLTDPPTGSPDYFVNFGTNSLNIWQFHVDWTTPANSTFTGPTNVAAAAFTPLCPTSAGCVVQPGTATKLDALGDRLMYRLAYRNFGAYESLVVDHTVNPGTGGGVRWYEIRSPGSSPTIFQQGTFAPDSQYRWMGSIAMDQAGDIAVGYSLSSSSTQPSILYTGRVVGDPPGTLPQGEITLQSGTGSQNGNLHRWGDYSSMSVDPTDDCTFWYTTEYLTTTGSFNWHTRIGSFKFPSCSSCTPPSPPTASNNGPICSGQTLQLTASTVAGATYSWTGPNGFTSSAQNPSIANATTAATGTYSVTVTVASCTSAPATTVATVNPTPDPTIAAAAAVCGASTGNAASVAGAGAGATYGWTITNGTITAGAGTAAIAYTAGASGSVSLGITVTTAAGCSATGSKSVTVNAVPSAPTASNNGPICAGATLQLTASTVAGATYSWTGPNGFASSAQNPSIANATAAATGTYSVTATVSGCTSAAGTTAATVNAVPSAPTASNNGPICAGGTLQLTASTVSGATYGWTGPNGFTSSAQNPSIANATTAATGTYSVTATVSGCTSSAGTTAATVNALPVASASGSAAVCAGQSTPLNGSGGASCSWSPVTGLDNPNSCSPNASPAATTTYTLTVAGANGCVSTNAPTVTVTVNPLPLPVITVTRCLTPNTSGLTASVASNAGDTYNWTLTAGAITAGQGTNAITFTSPGPATQMTLSVVETATSGCSGTATQTMETNFNDVPVSNPFYTFICTITRNGITAGCGSGNYCPTNNVLRSQMAVFILRGEHGATYVPPPATGIFGDVPMTNPFAPWIEEIYNELITNGCSTNPLLYCPSSSVTRASMSVFLLKGEHGSAYVPPPAQGIFGDVPITNPFAPWIEELYNEGITGGCSTNPLLYCPTNPVTRAQMSVFLTTTFHLP